MAENLEILLAKLLDETRPVRTLDLTELSDLARSEVGQVRLTWAALSEERRAELVTSMVEQAEANIHLNFHALLRTFLDDSDAQVRRAAIEGLWEDEKVNLIAPLLAMLGHDPAVEVRAAAATSLGRYVLLGVLGEIDEEPAQLAEEGLTSAWYRAGEPVEVRRRALESLAYLGTPAVSEFIHNAYYDENALMRQSALFAMGRSADRRWARVVLAELGSQEPAMRFEAAVAAGEMGLREAVQPLIRSLEDADSSVREASTAALGKIGGPAAKRALEGLLSGSDEALAVAAEDALDELNFNADHMDTVLMEVDSREERTSSHRNGDDLDDDGEAEEDDFDDDLDAGLDELDDLDQEFDFAGSSDFDDYEVAFDDESDDDGWDGGSEDGDDEDERW